MLSLTKTEPHLLFPRPAIVERSQGSYSLERWLDQPDLRHNPRLMLKLFLEGITLHRRSFALASRAERVLDLGCGGGWFSIAVGRANPRSSVLGLDSDQRLLNWGQFYWEHLKRQGKVQAELEFQAVQIENFPWTEHEESFDLVHAGFILSRCKDPGAVLQGIYSVLRPGGWLIYHDCTDPPPENLDALARWSHLGAKWREPSSDPWSWRRLWEQRYRFDVVRALARTKEPDEQHVVRRLEELFAIRFQERRRAFLDIFLRRTNRSPVMQSVLLPTVKFTDDLVRRLDILQGACRYINAQKR